jgi:hypothetical protein
MATAKPKAALAQVRASVKQVRTEGERMLSRLRHDAGALVARGQAQVIRDIKALRKEIRTRADRALREIERKVMKQLHAASESQVKRLEQRVLRLERQLSGRSGARGAKAA